MGGASRSAERTSKLRSETRPRIWALLRLAMVVATLAATIEQARLAVEAAAAAGVAADFAIGRLFTFFTVLSNVWLIAVFTLAAVRVFIRREREDPVWLSLLLASMSTSMLVTGLVYNIVLRAVGDADIMGGWSNDVHHVIGPLFVLADVLFAPRRGPLPWRMVAWGLGFPLGWVAATLVTGPFRVALGSGAPPWYPYPFLDPASAGGYGGVALWVTGISLEFAAVMTFVVSVGRRRASMSY